MLPPRSQQVGRRGAMQATLSSLSSFLVRMWVLKIFRMIRSTQRTPLMWHSAQAVYVSKQNGKRRGLRASEWSGHVSLWSSVPSQCFAAWPGCSLAWGGLLAASRTKKGRGSFASICCVLAIAISGYLSRDAYARWGQRLSFGRAAVHR